MTILQAYFSARVLPDIFLQDLFFNVGGFQFGFQTVHGPVELAFPGRIFGFRRQFFKGCVMSLVQGLGPADLDVGFDPRPLPVRFGDGIDGIPFPETRCFSNAFYPWCNSSGYGSLGTNGTFPSTRHWCHNFPGSCHNFQLPEGDRSVTGLCCRHGTWLPDPRLYYTDFKKRGQCIRISIRYCIPS